MALRNSVKAACLSFDNEAPRPPDPEVTAWRKWEDELRAQVAAMPGQVCLDEAAPAPVPPAESEARQTPPESDARQTRPRSNARPTEGHAFLASSWHARAETLRAMAGTLPSKPSGALMPKIAALYDQFAREA